MQVSGLDQGSSRTVPDSIVARKENNVTDNIPLNYLYCIFRQLLPFLDMWKKLILRSNF
ncbi:hypothetical protein DSUL_30103 [Desulfovibrionales bacterium]